MFPEKPFYHRDPTRNLVRFAEVWLDEYKEKVYRRSYFSPPDSFKNSKSLETRKELRRNLKCKPFDWFLETVFPQFSQPEDIEGQFGFLHSPNLEWCLAISSVGELIWEQCRFYLYTRPLEQLWELNSKGQIINFGSKGGLDIIVLPKIASGDQIRLHIVNRTEEIGLRAATSFRKINNQGDFFLKNEHFKKCLDRRIIKGDDRKRFSKNN